MKSMTGHAYEEWSDDTRSVTIEAKSYNNRYLDINVYIPGRFSPLERRVRELVSQRVVRGKVECSIRPRLFEQSASIHVDTALAAEYAAALRKVAESAGIRSEPSISDITAFEGVVIAEPSLALDEWWAWLEPKLEAVLDDLDATRQREGAALERVLGRERGRLSEVVRAVDRRADDLQEHIRESILERFRELQGEAVDEQRVLGETAVLLVKYSIREELDRLQSHLSAFDTAAREGGAIGKKLDFICQEIGREVNTIASKSIFEDVNAAAITAKDALENIREQLRNIE